MAWVTLRQFTWTTRRNKRGVLEVDVITPVPGRRKLTVELSDVIWTNALATIVPGPALYDATQNEVRLLGSYLHHAPRQPIQLHEKAFRASARHIRGFVSESLGLGMLTATVEAARRWDARGQVVNMDVVPTALSRTYSRSRTRPDLLFATPTMWLAGEARGRSRRAPGKCRQEHYQRLDQLLPWADHHQHDLIMTWAYATEQGVTVDLFVPAAGGPDLAEPIGDPVPFDGPGQSVPADTVGKYEDLAPPSAQLHGVVPNIEDQSFHESEETGHQQRTTRFDTTAPRQVEAIARRWQTDIEDMLFETAPRPERPVSVAGHALRGTWVPLDLVGPSTGSLLLAVLDQPLTRTAGWEATDLLRRRIRGRLELPQGPAEARSVDAPLSATVRGRLLVAVASEGFDQPWDWIADD